MSLVDPLSTIFKSLVWDVAIKKYSFELLASLAISPTGFLGIVITKAIIHLTEKLYPIFTKMIKVGEVKLSNEVHQRIYEKAQYKLKVIAIEKGIDSDEFKKQRDIEHDKLVNAIVYSV